jgi:hypothetical protein
MRSHHLTKVLTVILTVALVAPSAFLIAPQKAQAAWPVTVVGDIVGWVQQTITAAKTTFSAIKDELNLISTYTNTAANVAQQINTYVLQPLAFIMSGNLLKLLTASVLDFITNGMNNGTGGPMLVQDINGMMQRVGDIQANAFFLQFGRNSNSPFASSISSALRSNYYQNTSSAGFWAANRNTMSRYSPNPNAFLSGNWSQGGIGAWFALTTQPQNNPYMLYQASQNQLASVVQSAQAARKAVLDWGQGFMSWCGTPEVDTTASNDGTEMEGTNPGDFCINSDGTPGTIKTPGSTIKATLDKVLGSTQDKLTQMGSVAKEVNGILGQVGNIMGGVGTVIGTVQFASSILGGSSGGLFGVNQTSGSNTNSRLFQYREAPGFLGTTQSTVVQNAATLTASGSDTSSRLDQYESSWNTIRSSANSASTTLDSLASFCEAAAIDAENAIRTDDSGYYGGTSPSSRDGKTPAFVSASRTQANSARTAIATHIVPVITQANATVPIITTARTMVQRLRSGESATTQEESTAYLADLQALQSMPPSDQDISNAMENAISTMGGSVAIPGGSLNVSGGSIVGRMTLLGTNAEALKTSVCTPVQIPDQLI